MLRGRTLAYPGLTVIVLSPCVVIPSVSPSDVSMSVFSWSHCQVCVSWHWDQLSLVRICSLHLLLFSVALSLMVVSSLTVCLLFWCKGLVLLVCLLVFFFHFSLIKPVMSLLLDSLSLVFGSKLCLAGFSLLLLRPLASEKVGRPSCMEIQACQGSQMIGWPGNCAHPTGCRSLMQLHEWSTGVGCPFCLCVAALMISGLCICMCHLNAHWLYLPG